MLFASFERPLFAERPGETALVVLIGSSIVVGATVTVTAQSLLWVVIHNVLLNLAFAIFTLAFVHNKVVVLRLLAAALIIALALRLFAQFKPAAAPLASAG